MSHYSHTALLVAAERARATALGDGLCHDPWAAALAGAEGRALAEEYERIHPHLTLWVALRTAAIDQQVMRSVEAGHAQVVVLGAGFDTRAARLARPGVRYFEVDSAETQAEKLRRLQRLGDYPLDAAAFVPCDFERQDFLTQLAERGFDRRAAALFIWEGVSYYLSEPAVQRTLRRVATGTAPAARLVFDYVQKKLVEGALHDAADLAVRQQVARLGEPFRYGVNDVLPLLYDAGFRQVRLQSFDELCLNLTGSYRRERKFRFQGLALASRLPLEPT